MHFCQSFGLSKLLSGQENGSQKDITGWEFGSQNCLPDVTLAFKGITEREFGSQNHSPDENLAMTFFYFL